MRLLLPLIFLAATACNEHETELEAVRLNLTDPASAQFEDVETKDGVTCGFVNAKNRMGGYVGFRAFIVTAGLAEIESDLGEFAERFPTACPRAVSKKYIDRLAGQISAYDTITSGDGTPP